MNMSPFPEHAGSLELTHNDFKSNYETAEEWIDHIDKLEKDNGVLAPDWESPEHKKRAIDTNEIWELHWYPRTPIGFHYIAAPTFDELVKFAKTYE